MTAPSLRLWISSKNLDQSLQLPSSLYILEPSLPVLVLKIFKYKYYIVLLQKK